LKQNFVLMNQDLLLVEEKDVFDNPLNKTKSLLNEKFIYNPTMSSISSLIKQRT
jgi:hypothetical protein